MLWRRLSLSLLASCNFVFISFSLVSWLRVCVQLRDGKDAIVLQEVADDITPPGALSWRDMFRQVVAKRDALTGACVHVCVHRGRWTRDHFLHYRCCVSCCAAVGVADALQTLTQTSDPSVIVRVMLACLSVAGIQHLGCIALQRCSSNPTQRQQAVLAGSIEAVLSALQMHTSVLDVVTEGCRALSVLVAEAPNQQWAGDVGACEEVVAVLMTHPTAAAVHEAAGQAISALVALHAVNAQRCAVALSGVSASELAALMQHSAAVAAVQAIACDALAGAGLVTEVLVAPVLAALQAHVADAAVQRAGLQALLRLTALPAHLTRVMAARGQMIVEITQRAYPADEGIQHAAISMLERIAGTGVVFVLEIGSIFSVSFTPCVPLCSRDAAAG